MRAPEQVSVASGVADPCAEVGGIEVGGTEIGGIEVEGFGAAIAMAEAASCGNPAWWNEIRSHADGSTDPEYAASVLLGTLIRAQAHRHGIAVCDIWDTIRRTGRLPL